MMHYDNNIKGIRKELGLSQKKFAKIVGIDPSLVSRYERKKVLGIGIKNVTKIMKAFPQYKVSDITWIAE